MPPRRPDQLWVSFVQESPSHSGWVDPLQNLFNWTMSYRMDSEIWAPYGRKLRLAQKPEAIFIGNTTLKNWIKGKSKLVFGAISHCKTPAKREILIEKMNETGIAIVDVYGACGNRPMCGLLDNYNRKCDNFWENVAAEYKFFLAFENSLCIGYITEKFWRTLDFGMVPVVLGGANYSGEAPPYSFIDARDFKTAKELMQYLKLLDENDEEYEKYFEWRWDYKIEEKQTWHRAYCNLCRAVGAHKKGEFQREKVYENLKHWWHHKPGSNESACEKSPVFL